MTNSTISSYNVTENTTSPLENQTLSVEDREFQSRLVLARNIIVPTFVLVGLVGNSLSILVFTTDSFKQVSPRKCLMALAAADNVFLLTLLLMWLNDQVQVLTSAAGYKVVVYLSYMSSFLSVSFVVCFTVERYIAVCHPLRARVILAKVPGKVVMGLLVTVAAVLYHVSLWATTCLQHEQRLMCQPDPASMHVLSVVMWVDTALTLVLPSLLLVVLNSLVAVAIVRSYRQRRRLSHAHMVGGVRRYRSGCCRALLSRCQRGKKQPPAGHVAVYMRALSAAAEGHGTEVEITTFSSSQSNSSSDGHHGHQGHQGRRSIPMPRPPAQSPSNLRTTVTLLMASVTFLLLNAPSHVFRLQQLISVGGGSAPSRKDMMIQEVTQLTYYSSHVFNVFVYMIYGTPFLQAMCELARKARRRVCRACRIQGQGRQGGIVCVKAARVV